LAQPGAAAVRHTPHFGRCFGRDLGSCHAPACDAANNLFIAGAFQGTTYLDDYSLTASDSSALFLPKYDVFGNAIWAREIASSLTGLNALHLFFDDAGQLYLAAGFDGVVSFGDQWLSSRASAGVFLAQFDTRGERRWLAKLPAGASTDGRAFAADAAGRVFNTGSFSGTVAFGSQQITSPYVNAMYLARLDGNLTVAPAMAVRELPPLCQPGVPFTVRLRITPDPNAVSWAVVDQAPAGWAPSNISDDGGWRTRIVTKTAASSSQAVRSLPAIFAPGEPLPVSIAATPGPGVKAFALEESVPAGWTVSGISHDGEFNPIQRRVKWGPFSDATPRTLTYQAAPAADASGHFVLAGQASFDGANQPVTGQGYTASSCRLVARAGTNAFRLTLTAPPGAILQIEGSSNLTHWTPLTLLTNQASALEFDDPAAPASRQRFHRAVLFE
jgi:hypothetical protein